MKRKVAVLLLIVLSFTMVSCSSSKENDTITIWTHSSADTPEGKMFAKRIEEYNESNPDKLQVEIQNITRAGAGSGYIDKLNAAITSDDVPEIFTLDGPDVGAYAEAGVIGPLDDYLSSGFKDGFTEAMIEQGTFDNQYYAMGFQDSGVIVMYNEKMIKALPESIQEKIPASDEDWTFNEMVEILREVDAFAKETDHEAFDKYETAISLLLTDISSGAYELGTYYFAPLLWGNGAQIVKDDGLTVDGYLNSEKSLDAMLEYSKLFEEPTVALASEPDKTFNTEKSAFAVAGNWYIGDLVKNYPDVEFRSVRYPKIEEGYDGLYTPSGSWAFVRSSKIEDEDKLKQVVEVMEFLTNDEASEEYYLASGAIPARKDVVDVIDTNTDNEYYNEAWSVLKYQVGNTNKSRPISPGYPYLSETFAKDVILKIAENKATDEETIQKYLDDAATKIELEFEKYKN